MESSYSIFLRDFGSRPSKRILRKFWSQGGIVEFPAWIKSLLREGKGGMEPRVHPKNINNGIMGCSLGDEGFLLARKGEQPSGKWNYGVVGREFGMDGMTNRNSLGMLGWDLIQFQRLRRELGMLTWRRERGRERLYPCFIGEELIRKLQHSRLLRLD